MIKEEQIEKKIEEIFSGISFTGEPAGLYDPLRYMISIGGKRIRPRLCLTSYALYRDSFEDAVCEAAQALEVFHAFTLIHDDIMDKATLRRGMPTVCRKWGSDSAILSGDVMCIDSYRRLCRVPAEKLPDVLELFSRTAAQVCEGQQLDMEFESEKKIGMDDYIGMIGLKTAVLLACSAKMGALIAGAAPQDCNAIYDYAYNLGLAFQIADDYLDSFGNKDCFGKEIGGDILNNKKSWLLTRAMEKDADAVLKAMALPCGTKEADEAKIRQVCALYRSMGIDEEAKSEILRYNSAALDTLKATGLGKIQTGMLARYADRLVGRTK